MRTIKAGSAPWATCGHRRWAQAGGERVVVEGLQKVRDGVTVNPKSAEARAAQQ